MFKKKLPLIIFSSFLFLFFFLFPKRIGKDMVMIPHLLINEESGVQNGEFLHWLEAEHFFYALNSDSKLFQRLEKYDGATFSPSVVVQQKENELFMDEKMIPLKTVDNINWFTIENRIFSLDLYRSIAEWDKSGSLIWQSAIPSSLTALSVSKDRVLLGFIDGSMQILDDQGGLLQSFSPGGSRIEVIYGISISDDNRYISILSGLSPQRFMVLELKEKDYRPVYHHNLSSQFRRPVCLQYQPEGNFFYYESSQGVDIYYPDTRKVDQITLKGQIQEIIFPENLNLPLILSKDGKSFYLNAFVKDKVFYTNQYSADFSTLFQENENIYWIVNDDVFFMEWTKK